MICAAKCLRHANRVRIRSKISQAVLRQFELDEEDIGRLQLERRAGAADRGGAMLWASIHRNPALLARPSRGTCAGQRTGQLAHSNLVGSDQIQRKGCFDDHGSAHRRRRSPDKQFARPPGYREAITCAMIRSFRDRETELLFDPYAPKRWNLIARPALRKLRILHLAKNLADLRVPPGNRLELLRGDQADGIAFG